MVQAMQNYWWFTSLDFIINLLEGDLVYIWNAHFGGDVYLGDHICICILVTMHTYFGGNVHLGDHICILVVMYIFWRRCAFGRSHLHLHFGCNVYILEEMHT